MTTYIPVIQVRFNTQTGAIIYKNGSTPNVPAINATENPVWRTSSTIYDLQKIAFDKLKRDLEIARGSGSGSGSGSNAVYEPSELQTYYAAVNNIINFNRANGSGSGSHYFIAFFNPAIGNNLDNIEAQYNHLLGVRHELSAKLSDIQSMDWTINHQYEEQYRQGIYVNTLVAIAAVSLLYIVFVSM